MADKNKISKFKSVLETVIAKPFFINFLLPNMASGDTELTAKHMTYSRSRLPIIGALVDYLETSLGYLRRRSFANADKLHMKRSRGTLSGTFLAAVCLLLGLACNVKFEVVTHEQEPLVNDLHFMLMSEDEKLYVDDVDADKVMWCLEGSDLVVMLISCLMIWNSHNVRSPTSEYLFLPWMGATIRGLFLRQAPTAGALIYTMAVVNGTINPLFLTAFTFLFLLEVRLWLEVARIVHARWERRNHAVDIDPDYEVETLWSSDGVQSVEVRNFLYAT